MMKRVSWFVGGAVAGAAGAGYAKRRVTVKVKETAAHLAPVNVARTTIARIRHRSNEVVDAVRDGREAMRAKEAELRAKLQGASTLADQLDPTDQVLVDGRPVEPGQVIVLRQVRDEQSGPRRHSRRNRHGA